MIDIHPFRREDFASANQVFPLPNENTFWFSQRTNAADSKEIRRNYVALDAGHVVGYSCLERPVDNSETLRALVVCSPANLRGEVGEGLYLRLIQDANELGATTLWVREYQADDHIREFLTSRSFDGEHPYPLLERSPIVIYKLQLL